MGQGAAPGGHSWRLDGTSSGSWYRDGNMAGFVLSLSGFALEVSAPETLARTAVRCTVLRDWASRRRHERCPSTCRAQRGPQIHDDQQSFYPANGKLERDLGI